MANAKFDRDSVDNEQIRALCAEVEQRGDAEMAALCVAALDGDSDAAEKCIDAIEAAAGMAD